MEAHEEELIKRLSPENPVLEAAYLEHNRLKAKVEKLTSRPHLTPEDELQKKEMQKLTLAEKAKLVKILADHRREAGSSQAV